MYVYVYTFYTHKQEFIKNIFFSRRKWGMGEGGDGINKWEINKNKIVFQNIQNRVKKMFWRNDLVPNFFQNIF